DVRGGAAVLTAEREALQKTQQHEQRSRKKTGGRVGGQQSDERRRKTHRRHSNDERVFAPDAVADMSEHHRAERPYAEAGTEGREAREQLSRLVTLREEQAAEENRQAAVKIEVVPLEQRA